MRLANLRHLTPAAALFLAQLLPLSLALRLSIRLLGFNRAVALLPRGRTPERRPDEAEMARVSRMIHWARYFSPAANCLSTATAAWWLLRRRGIVTTMRFGTAAPVAPGRGKLQAHAWLEYQGQPVTNERALHQRYQVFDRAIL